MTTPLVRPFTALRPAAGRAAEVAAPPYDVPTTAEARAEAADRPWSFLHVSRPEIDLGDGVDPHGPEAYTAAAVAMHRLLDVGVLVRDPAPAFHVYRLTTADHEQTGIAAAAAVAAYESGRIRRHEFTRPDKEIDRARHIEAVGAHTGPVLTAHRPDPVIAGIVHQVTGTQPDADVTRPDGVRHRVWSVSDAAACRAIGAAFEAMPTVYIADGHHRSAAAVRVAQARRAAGAGDERFLIVSFPANEVRILDYNRVVRDLNGMSPAAFLQALERAFAIEASATPVRPTARAMFGMYLDGRWYRLGLRQPPGATAPPLDRLDVAILSRTVLDPLLGVGDPRTDPRIDFVGGARGLDGLAARVAPGAGAVAFSLFPTSMDDLIAVADAGQVMPPKSTWFEPKLADGLLSLPLD